MLIDQFGRTIDYVRISVTDRCDLRCTYCMPEDFDDYQNPKHWLTFDELERVVAAFARLGTKHFRLTGGEPLMRARLTDFIGQISQIEGVEDISLSTNGTQLKRHAKALREAGLNRLNISLDSLDPEHFKKVTGRDVLAKVLEGLKEAKEVGFTNIKINAVASENFRLETIESLIAYCIENRFILRLIELMPMGESARQKEYVDLTKLLQPLKTRFGLIPTTRLLGPGPARYWESPDGHFTLGLITPMSQHFCDTCNRVRLTADGTVYACLGHEHTHPLRPLLRDNCTDAELEDAIRHAVSLKPKKHEFTVAPFKLSRVMSRTGG